MCILPPWIYVNHMVPGVHIGPKKGIISSGIGIIYNCQTLCECLELDHLIFKMVKGF